MRPLSIAALRSKFLLFTHYVVETDTPADTPKLSREARLMQALDAICRKAEEAMGYLQDDGRMTGPRDKSDILCQLHTIDARVKEIRELLRTSGTYSLTRLDGDSDP